MSESNSERFHLLVIDDDRVDRMAVRRALRATGLDAEIEEREDAASAIAALREGDFDCAFLDFQLPDGDGLRVLRTAQREGIPTPIVVLTGQEDTQVAVELMKAGAVDYLSKGRLSPERLEQSLLHATRLADAQQQTRRAEAERERASASRSRFFAAMSHELRTPINAIVGYHELLLDGLFGALTEEQEDKLGRAQKAARHLLELVNDVLDLAKIEAGRLEVDPEAVRIPELIQDLFATVRPLARDHGSEVQLIYDDCVDPIFTDPRRVRQILLNLLSNALKFGQASPVNVRCTQHGEQGVVVEVVDQGIGISAEQHERIFEEFVQLDTADAGGTGLGLPISRSLAQLLGGRLEVESHPGEGSTFRLVLPRTIDLSAAP